MCLMPFVFVTELALWREWGSQVLKWCVAIVSSSEKKDENYISIVPSLSQKIIIRFQNTPE